MGAELSPHGGYKAGGTLNGPDNLVFDGNGNLWITNNLDNTVEAINGSGSVAVGPFGTSSTYFGPKGLALDSFNQVWVADNQSSDHQKQLTVSTTSGAFLFFVGHFGLDTPVELAADTTVTPNIIWASNFGDKGASRIVDDGTSKLKGKSIHGGGQEKQGGITLDACGDAWVTNTTGSVTEILSGKKGDVHDEDNDHGPGHYFAVGPIASGGISSSSDPFGITTDSANHVWVLNQSGNSVTELNNRGKALSPTNGFTALGAINGPYNGIAIDRSGNVWIANAGNNTVTQFVGSAAPVATPRTQGRPIPPSGATPTTPNIWGNIGQ